MDQKNDLIQRLAPAWLKEFHRFLTLKSQFYLSGNVYDCYYFPAGLDAVEDESKLAWGKWNNLSALLREFLFNEGYDMVVYFDIIDGILVYSKDSGLTRDNLIEALSDPLNKPANSLADFISGKVFRRGLAAAHEAIDFFRFMVKNKNKLAAGIVNFSSRFSTDPNSLDDSQRELFLKILKAAQESRVFHERQSKKNILVFICDKLNDIPAWLLLENPLTKGITILKPGKEERAMFFQLRMSQFFCEGEEPNREELAKILPDLTDGFTNMELENLTAISKRERIHVNQVREIIDLYKYGVRENPWTRVDDKTIREAVPVLKKRVLGQDQAIKKCAEVLRRSKLGLESIDQVKFKNKPKGVLFFAGPTGTGKTELAKALAELIFSDEDAIIRFDMSEYDASNSDVKLIGSPPGYVGYDEGGQLTGKVKSKPFCLILFDEIEKAHPKIFDKFMQILDDGRLTDGKGETVYFSQTLIIFTSNLGIRQSGNGSLPGRINASIEDSYQELSEKIMMEIKKFFTVTLNRPEVLNRFGNNFVVFDYIRKPVDKQILLKNLEVMKVNLLKFRDIRLEYDDHFIDLFINLYINPNIEMGGRGILNQMETYIKNGITNFLFDNETGPAGGTLRMSFNEVVSPPEIGFTWNGN